MRRKVLGFAVGIGLLAATAAPAFACAFHAQEASDQKPPQQTAQAQPPSDTKSQ